MTGRQYNLTSKYVKMDGQQNEIERIILPTLTQVKAVIAPTAVSFSSFQVIAHGRIERGSMDNPGRHPDSCRGRRETGGSVATPATQPMSLDDIARAAEYLGYRDKLRLAQWLIHEALGEEEYLHAAPRAAKAASDITHPEFLHYAAQRLNKLRPARKAGVLNSIGAMFQHQGGLSDSDKQRIFDALLTHDLLRVGEDDRVQY